MNVFKRMFTGVAPWRPILVEWVEYATAMAAFSGSISSRLCYNNGLKSNHLQQKLPETLRRSVGIEVA